MSGRSLRNASSDRYICEVKYMLLSKYQELDTPSLLIDMGVVRRNIERVQKIANDAAAHQDAQAP